MVGLSFVVIFVTGLLDDRYSLSPKQKLAGQVTAASIGKSDGRVTVSVDLPLDNASSAQQQPSRS